MAFVGGYTVFLPGNWDVTNFIFSYAMIGILPILFIFWKIKNRTKVCLLRSVESHTNINKCVPVARPQYHDLLRERTEGC
jgi:amino acid transporter